MIAAARPAVAREPDADASVLRPLVRLLDDLASAILQTPPSAYPARPLPGVTGSIGEHVRHVLDHVATVAGAHLQGVLSYDRRERGTTVEVDPHAGLQAILRAKAALQGMELAGLDRPMTVCAVLSRAGEPTFMRSTLRRELAYVISHTIHHHAVIAMLLSMAGGQVPDSFGLAPSTPRQS